MTLVRLDGGSLSRAQVLAVAQQGAAVGLDAAQLE